MPLVEPCFFHLWFVAENRTVDRVMAHLDRAYLGMRQGSGPGLIQCQSIGPI